MDDEAASVSTETINKILAILRVDCANTGEALFALAMTAMNLAEHAKKDKVELVQMFSSMVQNNSFVRMQ